jgi:hypothetical protein
VAKASRGFLLGILLIALCLLWFLSQPSPVLLEQVYSRGLYPLLSGLITNITGPIPFSLATVLLISLPLLWIIITLRSYQKRQGLGWWGWWLWHNLLALAMIYALFILFWGANYGRESVESLFALPETSISQNDVEVLADSLLTIIQNTVKAERNMDRAISSIEDALSQVNYNLTGRSLKLPQIKRLPAGWLILSGRASGAISPWTLEAHVGLCLMLHILPLLPMSWPT